MVILGVKLAGWLGARQDAARHSLLLQSGAPMWSTNFMYVRGLKKERKSLTKLFAVC